MPARQGIQVAESLLSKPANPDCPVREVFDHVGITWSALVITNLTDDLQRGCSSVEEWVTLVCQDYDFQTGYLVAKVWQAKHSPIK